VVSIPSKPASQKPTLSLKRKPPTPLPAPVPLKIPPAPLDGPWFFVWKIGASRPKQRHATLASVVAERDRLLALNPDSIFLVFEAKRVPV
jgi:hypothetical protein